MPIVALIEDDGLIRDALCRALATLGHEVQSAPSGLAGLRDIVDGSPEVVVLDLGLPDIDGLELLRMLRAVSAVPVIAATARDEETEIIRTLDAGADDYIVKPFSLEELRARIGAVLRRRSTRPEGPCRVGELTIDPMRRRVTVGDRPVQLAKKEFTLLRTLAADPTRVFTKAELLLEVWGFTNPGKTRTLDSHASRLRRKLDPDYNRYVINCWGIGYRLIDG
jgi:two-component system, OmpR family, KDP operon response regulator KdpE